MHRFGPEVARSIAAARQTGAKVSIFDERGFLLWYCDHWECDVGRMHEWNVALGRGWLEFVHPGDLPAVAAWFTAGDGAEVLFRTSTPDGKEWQAVVLKKRRVGLYWLAVGDRRPLGDDERPAMSCIILAAAALLHAWPLLSCRPAA
jgi:hypothetical protein